MAAQQAEGYDNDDLTRRMQADKKASAGTLRLVLPDARSTGALGTCTVVTAPPVEAVHAGWDAIRA